MSKSKPKSFLRFNLRCTCKPGGSIQGIVGCTPTNVPRHGKSQYKPYKYHGYTVRGTPNCPLKHGIAP